MHGDDPVEPLGASSRSGGLVKTIVIKRRRRGTSTPRNHRLEHQTKVILFWVFALLVSAGGAYACGARLTSNLEHPPPAARH